MTFVRELETKPRRKWNMELPTWVKRRLILFLNLSVGCAVGRSPDSGYSRMMVDYLRRQKNPVTAGLVYDAEDYKYSPAKFYVIWLDEFKIITHHKGN